MHASACSAFVESEIEFAAIKEREDIVKKRIAVREVDDTAYRNDQKMRMKLLVLLDKLIMTERGCGQFDG